MQSLLQKTLRQTPAKSLRKFFIVQLILLIVMNSRAFAALTSNVNVGKLDAMGEPRFLENVKQFLAKASANTKIPADMLAYIESCNSVIRFNIPLKMDDGTIRTVPCYR